MPAGGLPVPARWIAVLLTLVPLGFALAWSHLKYFWIDELLEYFSDSRVSAAAVIFGQRHFPFSLEPPLYHLVLHFCLRLFPHAPEFAARLPALLLFALLQWSVLRLVLRLTGRWGPALLAAALPFLLVTFQFAPEARVYELLAAMFALALLAYCTALQSEGMRRRLAVLVLFAALSTAVLSHYFGVFELLPFVAAEAVRSVRRRRAEAAFWLALLGAVASFALNLPFLQGLKAVQARYYDASNAAWDRIPFTYAWLFGQNDVYDHDPYSTAVRRIAYALVFVVLPAAVVAVALRRRQMAGGFAHRADSDAVLLAVLTGLFLPVLSVTAAHLVTHAYMPRYSVATVVPVVIALSLGLAPWLRGWRGTAPALLLVLGLGCWVAMVHIDKEQRLRFLQDHLMVTTEDLRAAEQATPDPHIYVQQVADFLELLRFAPPDQRGRFVEFESMERARFWDRQTPTSVFARNIGASTSLPFLSYEQLRRLPGPHLLLIFHDNLEEWIGPELATPGVVISLEPRGRAFGGSLYLVTFAPAP